MPLVLVHKAERIWKAKVARAKQDATALRAAYRIADRNAHKFAKVFYDIQRELFDDATRARVLAALRQGPSVEAVVEAIRWQVPGQPDEFWDKAAARLERAYADVVTEAGHEEAARVNAALGTNIKFQLRDVVEKATVPVVPPNPWGKKWISEQSGNLIQQYVTQEQKQMVRNTVLDAFSKGQRAEVIADTIERNIGLTTREARAVENRRDLYESTGMDDEDVESQTAEYADELRRVRANRIARTETVMAQAEGRNEMWRLARDSGTLPPCERVWVSVPGFGSKGSRTCEVCDGLDGKVANIDEPYETELGDAILRPPAHPNCRCTEILRRAEEED